MGEPNPDWGSVDSDQDFEPEVDLDELYAQYEPLPAVELRTLLRHFLATDARWRGPYTTRSLAVIRTILISRDEYS